MTDDVLSRLRKAPNADLALSVAGVSMTIAFLLSYVRLDAWAAFPKLVLVAIPCFLLFALALAPSGNAESSLDERPVTRWQVTFLIGALLLLELVLAQFADLFIDPGAGTAFWTFAVTAGVSAAIAMRADLPGATLLATLAVAGSLFGLIGKIDSNASASAYRDVLLFIGLVYIFGSRVTRPKMLEHSHVLAAVGAFYIATAAIIGILGNFNTGAFGAFGPTLSTGSGFSLGGNGGNGWELVLLIATAGAAVYAGLEGYRGAGFVGVIGLITFLGFAVSGNLFGWPFILILVAIAAVFYALQGVEDQGPRAPSPPPETGGTPPTQVRDAPPPTE